MCDLTEGPAPIDILRAQIKAGFERRDSSFVQTVFTRHSIPDETKSLNLNEHIDECPPIIPKVNISAALVNLGVDVDEQRADELFQEFDTDNSNGLNLEEFQQLVRKPPQIVEWAKTLGLPELLADAMPRKQGANALRVVSELTDAEFENVIGALLDGLRIVLTKSAHELKQAFAASDIRTEKSMSEANSGSKFDLIPLSCGTIEDFHVGLEGRIGMCVPALPLLFAAKAAAQHQK